MEPSSAFTDPSPEFLRDPYLFYRMMHATDPVLQMPGLFGIGGWLVTSHAVCGAVLKDKRFGKEGDRVLSPEILAKIPSENTELKERRKSNLLFRDPPDHTRLRGLVNQAFTPRTVERLRPHVEEIANGLIDAFAGSSRFDLLREFAFPLPVIVIAELLGVPAADREQFKIWSTDLTLGLNPGASVEDFQKVSVAIEAMSEYFNAIIDDRRKEPRADLISDLVRAQEAGDRMSQMELLSTCRLILTAGHETTVNLIGNGALALLSNPSAKDALAADATLGANAVEEMLRFDSPVQMTLRFAMEDGPLGDKQCKRGDLVVLLLGAANRDPAHFPSPETFDIRRDNAHSHLSLGAGIHYCLGAPLARIEGQIAIGALLARLPKLALDGDAGPLVYRKNVVLRGLQSLPVTA